MAGGGFAYGNNEFNNYNACSSSPNAYNNTNQFLNTSNSNYNDFTDFAAETQGRKLIVNNKTPNWKHVTSKYSQSALNRSNTSSGDKPRMASSRNSSRDSSPGRSSGTITSSFSHYSFIVFIKKKILLLLVKNERRPSFSSKTGKSSLSS